MKSYEIMPTYENLIKTFKEDTLGRNKDIISFVFVLNSFSNCTSIALDGKWGSGKTFFVKQTKLFLDAHNDFFITMKDEHRNIFRVDQTDIENYIPQVCVYYDAWENDNDQDPILSLVYSILSNIDDGYKLDESESGITKALGVLETITGRNIVSTFDNFKGKDLLYEVRKSKNIENKIKSFLDEILYERGDRLIVFVDELDRCKPSYAVKLLERIKHYFTNDRITFVFSINTNELQHTIRKYYGNDFDAMRYLDRFFDLRFSIPPVNIEKYYNSINFVSNDSTYNRVCNATINYLGLSLRESEKYIRMVRIAIGDEVNNSKNHRYFFPDERGEFFCLIFFVPIMIGLKLIDNNQYRIFIEGKNPSLFIGVLKTFDAEYFTDLLSRNETYDMNKTEMQIVNVENKLEKLYSFIFKFGINTNDYDYLEIGNCRINKKMKNTLIRITSLMSQYTNVNYEENENN